MCDFSAKGVFYANSWDQSLRLVWHSLNKFLNFLFNVFPWKAILHAIIPVQTVQHNFMQVWHNKFDLGCRTNWCNAFDLKSPWWALSLLIPHSSPPSGDGCTFTSKTSLWVINYDNMLLFVNIVCTSIFYNVQYLLHWQSAAWNLDIKGVETKHI